MFAQEGDQAGMKKEFIICLLLLIIGMTFFACNHSETRIDASHIDETTLKMSGTTASDSFQQAERQDATENASVSFTSSVLPEIEITEEPTAGNEDESTIFRERIDHKSQTDSTVNESKHTGTYAGVYVVRQSDHNPVKIHPDREKLVRAIIESINWEEQTRLDDFEEIYNIQNKEPEIIIDDVGYYYNPETQTLTKGGSIAFSSVPNHVYQTKISEKDHIILDGLFGSFE